MVAPRAPTAVVACKGRDRLSAARAAIVAGQMRRHHDGTIAPYHCDHCGGWHVGKNTQRRPSREEVDDGS